MKFHPCIDLHDGKVKQIVGSTLKDGATNQPVTNFEATHSSGWFAQLYKKDNLRGGHVIKLGQGNDEAAKEALSAWPDGMQIGGGINEQNALEWIKAGASAVIVTSYIFQNGIIHNDRLKDLANKTGKNQLVLDLSCRKKEGAYWIVTDRWQNFTDVKLSFETLDYLAQYCSEFLVHAVDVEGLCRGIEEEVVEMLGKWAKIPITYAGGIHSLRDIDKIDKLGKSKIDFTVGSALDIFGGNKIRYDEIKHYS